MNNEVIWDTLGKRWNLKILKILEQNAVIRFNELKHSIHGISSNVLSERLLELEELGVIKKILPEVGLSHAGYMLDERCGNLKKILLDLDDWVSMWAQYLLSKSNILNKDNSFEKCLSLLKQEITETEYNFIKDKLLYSDKTISSVNFNLLDKLAGIIIELYGEEMGNRVLKQLHDKMKLLGFD